MSDTQVAQPTEATGATPVKPPKVKITGNPKSKKNRGVNPLWKTSMIPVDLPPETHDVVLKASRFRDKTIPELYNEYIKAGIAGEWALLEEDAAKAPVTGEKTGSVAGVKMDKPIEEMTPEEAQAFATKALAGIAKRESDMEKAKAILAQANARAATATNAE